MAIIRVLTEADLQGQVRLDENAVTCVESAFSALASGGVVMPPILRLDIHENNGEVDVKTAYVPGLDSFAIKISPGFFDNPAIGLPSTNGLMVLFSAKTGLVEALLLDNGYLTDVRTAAAGAVAARCLSREDSETAAIFGAGAQAKLQLEALTLVRPIRQARIWGRRHDAAQETAAALSEKLGFEVSAIDEPEEAVRGADIVVTSTPSTEPLLKADWLEAGQHVTAMGSDAEHKNELEPAILKRADQYVCDRYSQCATLGELHHAIAAGSVSKDAEFPELGDVIAGKHPGRISEDQLTVCDLTGTGVQDTAIATFARERCDAAGIGSQFNS